MQMGMLPKFENNITHGIPLVDYDDPHHTRNNMLETSNGFHWIHIQAYHKGNT